MRISDWSSDVCSSDLPVLRRLHRLKIQLVERAVDDFQKADRRIGGGDAVLAERELVELPHALPLVLAQGVEKFEQFDRVERSGDQIVVTAAEIVVDVHAEQPAVVDRELRRDGGRIAAVERVADVEQDTALGQPTSDRKST